MAKVKSKRNNKHKGKFSKLSIQPEKLLNNLKKLPSGDFSKKHKELFSEKFSGKHREFLSEKLTKILSKKAPGKAQKKTIFADCAIAKKIKNTANRILNKIEMFCAGIVDAADILVDTVIEGTWNGIIGFFRQIHEVREFIVKNKKEILKSALYFVVTGVITILLFASTTAYQYTYNGRILGIVREQKDVLEILGLVSEELTQEYGQSVEIDPETDISFKRVSSYGKVLDTPDQVLNRFTYMGDIAVTAYQITLDGEVIAVVESRDVIDEVFNSVIEDYLEDNEDREYEYVGIAENVEVNEISTTVSRINSKASAKKLLTKSVQQEEVYKVKSGDTLYGICGKLGLTLKELKDLNPGLKTNTVLHVGDKLVTVEEIPLLTVETIEVSTFTEEIKYDTEYKESSAYYKGESITTKAGKNGKQKVKARLTRHNGQIVGREDLEVEVLVEPVSRIVVKGTKAVPPKKGTGTFIRPVNVGIYRGFGMRWGRMHEGIDLAASTGTAIHASDGGTVTFAGWKTNYGYTVIIDHGANKKTLYAHCSRFAGGISVGTKVYQGQTIAYVGSTGRSTGPHCHFEIWINGRKVNPANYV